MEDPKAKRREILRQMGRLAPELNRHMMLGPWNLQTLVISIRAALGIR
jgi:hypothetical protein